MGKVYVSSEAVTNFENAVKTERQSLITNINQIEAFCNTSSSDLTNAISEIANSISSSDDAIAKIDSKLDELESKKIEIEAKLVAKPPTITVVEYEYDEEGNVLSSTEYEEPNPEYLALEVELASVKAEISRLTAIRDELCALKEKGYRYIGILKDALKVCSDCRETCQRSEQDVDGYSEAASVLLRNIGATIDEYFSSKIGGNVLNNPEASPIAATKVFYREPTMDAKTKQNISDNQFSKYTESEKDAISAYTEGGKESLNPAYSKLNSIKRETEKENTFWGKQERDKYLDIIAELDKAMEKSEIPQDVLVFRGMEDAYMFLGPDCSKILDEKGITALEACVGHTFTDKGYVSTSVDPNKACGFSVLKHGVLCEINAPKGSLGICISTKDGTYSRENEILFSSGSKFIVNSVMKNPGEKKGYAKTEYIINMTLVGVEKND